MTIGVMVVSFHLSTLVTAAGIVAPFSEWLANVMYGGTCGKRLATSGAVVSTALPCTQSVVIMVPSDNLASSDVVS